MKTQSKSIPNFIHYTNEFGCCYKLSILFNEEIYLGEYNYFGELPLITLETFQSNTTIKILGSYFWEDRKVLHIHSLVAAVGVGGKLVWKVQKTTTLIYKTKEE